MAKGQCACGSVKFEMTEAPLVVHCCHCTWCQRETGTAFVLNAWIEARHVGLLTGEVEVIDTPSESGNGQRISRCPTCQVALWSEYSGVGPGFRFVRVGTLETPGAFPPDVHIFTSTKLPWVVLSDGAPVFEGYYRRSQVWSETSRARWEAERERVR